jgi:acetyl esterase/lipase
MTRFEDRLDPEIAVALGFLPNMMPHDTDLVEIRAGVDALFGAMAAQLPPPDSRVRRTDRPIPGASGSPDVLIRVYQLAAPRAEPAPGFLWIHGGGFFLGSYQDDSLTCEQIVIETGAVVVTVDYRLAPEHAFPAAPEDCYAALQWLASTPELKIDPNRLAVGGASAGGCLAAAVALMARDRGGPKLCYQLLLIPVTDDRLNTTSSYEVIDQRVWNRNVAAKAWKAYLHGSSGETSPYAAPARASDLSNLPPAYVHVEEQDLLRDEGIAYANRLMQAGVPTELHVYPGTFHGSFLFAPMAEVSQRAAREHLATLKRVLAAK